MFELNIGGDWSVCGDAARMSVVTLFITVVVDVVTKSTVDGVLVELLSAGQFVLMSRTMEWAGVKWRRWKDYFESGGLNVDHKKAMVVVNSGTTNAGLSIGNVMVV